MQQKYVADLCITGAARLTLVLGQGGAAAAGNLEAEEFISLGPPACAAPEPEAQPAASSEEVPVPGCLKLPWAQASRRIRSPLLRLHNGKAVQTTSPLLHLPVECCDRQSPAQRSWTLSASWRQARKKLRAALRRCSASRPSCSLFGLPRLYRCLGLLRQVRTPSCC